MKLVDVIFRFKRQPARSGISSDATALKGPCRSAAWPRLFRTRVGGVPLRLEAAQFGQRGGRSSPAECDLSTVHAGVRVRSAAITASVMRVASRPMRDQG